MKLHEIRQKTAYNQSALPTQKQATRTWLNSLRKQYPIALTLTIKDWIEIKNEKGTYYKCLDKNDIERIAKHFTQKLNGQIFGSSAKRFGKGLNYLIVIEGERTFKKLHLHMAIGGLPTHVKFNQIDELVRNAKLSVNELNEQHKVEVAGDGGWMEYLTKELGKYDTDNVLWSLA